MTSYLIKSILCSGILIVVYHLFLEREKMLFFNRFFLLAALVFSLTIPLISLEIEENTFAEPLAAASPAVFSQIETISDFDTTNRSLRYTATPWTEYIPYAFYLIAGLLVCRYLFNILTILRLRSQCRSIQAENAHFVLIQDNTVTFTFLKHIFIPEKAFENQQLREEILTHEIAHAKQLHSLDILFIELAQALMWINPFLLWYKKAIRLNHEFLADEAVLKEFDDVKTYQLLLLDTILYRRQHALTSSFNYSITKRRLAMMTKIKNLNRQYVKQTGSALLAFALAFLFSEKIYSQTANLEEVKVTHPKTASTLREVSDEEFKEFKITIEKYTKYVANGRGRIDPIITVPPATENELYKVYERMNAEQRKVIRYEGISVFQMDIPVKKGPTKEMFENWKRADIFGVWLNGKKVPNNTLDKYKYTDIAEYDLSKLYGAALKGRSYKYQLDILTNEEFDRTYEQRVNNRVIITRMGWLDQPQKKGR